METKRSAKFWVDVELRLGSFERTWFSDVMPLPKDYSMGSEMIADIEKVVRNHLALVGYLKEIGSAI